jgi:hypothetical protein
MIGVPSRIKTQTLNKGQGCTGKLSTEFCAIFPVDRAIEASMIGRIMGTERVSSMARFAEPLRTD